MWQSSCPKTMENFGLQFNEDLGFNLEQFLFKSSEEFVLLSETCLENSEVPKFRVFLFPLLYVFYCVLLHISLIHYLENIFQFYDLSFHWCFTSKSWTLSFQTIDMAAILFIISSFFLNIFFCNFWKISKYNKMNKILHLTYSKCFRLSHKNWNWLIWSLFQCQFFIWIF